MARPPRKPGQNVIDKAMLLRAWGLMGLLSAALSMGLFLLVLTRAGWTPGAPHRQRHPLHHVYLQATTATFAAIVACQIGTAFAARTQHSSLRSIGLFSNPLLLGGIAFELIFAAAVIYLPPLQAVFGTAALPGWVLALLVPMPVLVWGIDEAYRALERLHRAAGTMVAVSPQSPVSTARFLASSDATASYPHRYCRTTAGPTHDDAVVSNRRSHEHRRPKPQPTRPRDGARRACHSDQAGVPGRAHAGRGACVAGAVGAQQPAVAVADLR